MFKSIKTITYRVTDIEKAKLWYSEVLNTQPMRATENIVTFRIGSTMFSLSCHQSPMPDDSERVETYWEVEDIEACYKRLISLGAKPHMQMQTLLVANLKLAKVMDPFGIIIGLSGIASNPNDKSLEEKPSRTAGYVAFCRALAAKDERNEIKGPDYLADLFVGEEYKEKLTDSESIKRTIQSMSPLYGLLVSRTAFFDEMFRNAISDNFSQIIILGAGYDTRAYRFNNLLNNTTIYELDISSTQKRKLEILHSARIDIPSQVKHVSINFKTDNLADVLSNVGFDDTARTLFMWEGVTYYLVKDAVNATLNYIKSHSPHGSRIAFDYMTEKFESGNPAEPFQFWINSNEIATLLSKHGIEIIEHVDSKEMEKRYLTLKDKTLSEKSFGLYCFVHGAI